MSDFSLTLVLQIKTSKFINGMAKVSIKSEKITPFGGIFPFCRSSYRQSTGSPMYVIRLPVQRDCRFAGKRLLLWRWLRGGRYEPPDAPSLAASWPMTIHQPTARLCSSITSEAARSVSLMTWIMALGTFPSPLQVLYALRLSCFSRRDKNNRNFRLMCRKLRLINRLLRPMSRNNRFTGRCCWMASCLRSWLQVQRY